MLNIKIYTRNEGSKVKFSKIFVGAKSVFLKSVGAAAPTAPTLTRPLTGAAEMGVLGVL